MNSADRIQPGEPTCRVSVNPGTGAAETWVSTAHYSTAVASAPMGIALVGLDGRFRFVNPAMCHMVGYTADELLATMFIALCHPDDRDRATADLSAIVSGTTCEYRADSRYVHADGRVVWVNVVAIPVRDSEGRLEHVLVYIVDGGDRIDHETLTNHKHSIAVEERRRIARDLHDGLAHELTYVSSEVKRLRREPHDGAALERLATSTERALDEARRAISVLTSAQPEQLSLGVVQTAEDLTARHRVALELDVDPALDAAPEVSENLLRIVREAITNAARHGGATKVTVRGWRNGAVHLVIEDDGRGFDPAAVYRGFGLVSMRERAEAVGGLFVLSAAPGEGARIEVIVE